MKRWACRHVWRVKFELFLDIPDRLARRINKRTLREKDVRIDGASWPRARRYCEKCGRSGDPV